MKRCIVLGIVLAVGIILTVGLLGRAAPVRAQAAQDAAPKVAPKAALKATTDAATAPQASGTPPADSPDAMTDIHDIKPALAIGSGIPVWLWAVAGLAMIVALVAGIYLWHRRKRSNNEQTPEAQVAPDVRAFNELDELAAAANGLDARTFYFRLSAILRVYLEERYGFAAAEMTSEELLPAVDRLGWPGELNSGLRNFCRATDPVKFADAPAGQEAMAGHLAFTRQIIHQTRRGLEENETAGTPAAGAPSAPALVEETD